MKNKIKIYFSLLVSIPLIFLFSVKDEDYKQNNINVINLVNQDVLVADVLEPNIGLLQKIKPLSLDNNENIIYNNTTTIDKGRIQLYEDTFGTKLDGYDYDVVLPDGVPTVVAPNVIGMTVEQASEWSKNNLNRNLTIYETNCYGAEFTPGTIAKQSPQPGSLIPNDFNPQTFNSLTTGLTVWIEADNCDYSQL